LLVFDRDKPRASHCFGHALMERGQLMAYLVPEKVADPEAARRLTECQGYPQIAQRDVDQYRAAG